MWSRPSSVFSAGMLLLAGVPLGVASALSSRLYAMSPARAGAALTPLPLYSSSPAAAAPADFDLTPRRLTLEEEGRLACLAQREQALQVARYKLFRELGRTPTAEEWATATLGAEGGGAAALAERRREARAAKDALVRANGGLVVSIARGYQRLSGGGARGESLDDLVQEGTLGLIRAVEKYDPGVGARFGTYATAWIKASISAWLKRGDSLIRVPTRVLDLGARARKSSAELSRDLGRDATSEEVADAIGAASASSVESAVDAVAGSRVVSYDATAPTGDNAFLECIADDECVVTGDLKTDLTAALAAILEPRELRVVRLRYGLDDGTLRSTRECASLLGIGKESVRQICLKAFRKLRGTTHGAALLDYMD